jgi:hypothetical protein
MIRRILFFVIVMLLLAGFFYYGLPELKEFKEYENNKNNIGKSPQKELNPGEDVSITGKRSVTVDISIEDVCLNLMTGLQYEKCKDSMSCDLTCQQEGCKFFSLSYKSSDFSQNKCVCNCLEENKIKKALNPN